MESQKDWPLALRYVWLTGGLVAINAPESDEVLIKTHVDGHSLCRFNIPAFGAIFPSLRRLGFRIIGTTFITDHKQLEGLRAPEFRTAGLDRGWPVWDVFIQWRQITTAASRENAMRLMDIASRIAAGFEFSEMRLCDLAMAYSAQLYSHFDPCEEKDYQAFQDTNSPAVYKAIHSMFWEMAVLRDVLAEFIAFFCLSRSEATTLGGLRRSLNAHSSGDPFADEIMAISCKDPLGWLAKFGSYRDCFTHSAPLHQAAGITFAVQDRIVLPNGMVVPQIYYALPADPAEISKRRAKGALFETFKELAIAAARRHDRAKEPDALQYLHSCLCQLTDLAARLVGRSPIAPRPIVLTKDDIIGKVEVTQS